jgi:hypothetical protein
VSALRVSGLFREKIFLSFFCGFPRELNCMWRDVLEVEAFFCKIKKGAHFASGRSNSVSGLRRAGGGSLIFDILDTRAGPRLEVGLS